MSSLLDVRVGQCRKFGLNADLERGSPEYERLKEERSQVLWRAVEKVIPDIRQRTQIEMVRSLLIGAGW